MSAQTVAGRSLDDPPSYAADPNDIDIVDLSEDDVSRIVDEALKSADCTRTQLDQQAAEGEFTSEVARRMWFLVSSIDPSE